MRNSQTSALVAALVSLAGLGIAQEVPGPKPCFTIAISAPQTVVKTGSPIMLHLAETNVCDQPLPYGDILVQGGEPGQSLRMIDVRVYDSNGKPMPETYHGKTIHARTTLLPALGPGAPPAYIKKGETFSEESDLSREFLLDKPGTYTVQAERLDYRSNVRVKSNTVTLTLTAPTK
jgi:hypothetical protein